MKMAPIEVGAYSLAFAKLQKEYLSEQKECPERSFDYFYSKVKKPKVIPKKKGLK